MKLKPRTDLPKDIEEARRAAHSIQRACNYSEIEKWNSYAQGISTCRRRGHHQAGIPKGLGLGNTDCRNRCSPTGTNFGAALLELARSLDMLGVGRYEQLRKAIGEPVLLDSTDKPRWDNDSNQLWYKGQIVRDLSPRAINARMIFNSFQEDGWRPRTDSPLPGGKNSSKLRDAVRIMNENLLAIEFYCDGKAEGVTWQEI